MIPPGRSPSWIPCRRAPRSFSWTSWTRPSFCDRARTPVAAVGHAGGVYTEALQRSSYGCCHTRNPSLALQHSDFLTESLDIPWTTELNAIESIQDGSHPDAQRVDIHGPLQQRHVLHASQFCSARHESLSTPSFVDYLAEVKHRRSRNSVLEAILFPRPLQADCPFRKFNDHPIS